MADDLQEGFIKSLEKIRTYLTAHADVNQTPVKEVMGEIDAWISDVKLNEKNKASVEKLCIAIYIIVGMCTQLGISNEKIVTLAPNFPKILAHFNADIADNTMRLIKADQLIPKNKEYLEKIKEIINNLNENLQRDTSIKHNPTGRH